LQNGFWRSGGVPASHLTDSLSAAFKNHCEETLLTERYAKLYKHYGVNATHNNKGSAHENCAIESAYGRLKRKIDQQLMLRGSRNFDNLADYEEFISLIVAKFKRQCKTCFEEKELV
jgi:transposase